MDSGNSSKNIASGVSSAIVGTAMAIADKSLKLTVALAALAGALLLQIGANLANDYCHVKSQLADRDVIT